MIGVFSLSLYIVMLVVFVSSFSLKVLIVKVVVGLPLLVERMGLRGDGWKACSPSGGAFFIGSSLDGVRFESTSSDFCCLLLVILRCLTFSCISLIISSLFVRVGSVLNGSVLGGVLVGDFFFFCWEDGKVCLRVSGFCLREWLSWFGGGAFIFFFCLVGRLGGEGLGLGLGVRIGGDVVVFGSNDTVFFLGEVLRGEGVLWLGLFVGKVELFWLGLALLSSSGDGCSSSCVSVFLTVDRRL